MNLSRPYTLLTSIILMLPCFAIETQACTCPTYEEPPCSAFWRADAVFTGSVTSVTLSQEASFPHKLLVKFSIKHAFKGVKDKQLELRPETTTCGLEFEKGKEYLVYAYRNRRDDSLGTNACTRTTELQHAAGDLTYFQALSAGISERSILGKFTPSYRGTPVKDIKIVVEGNGENHNVIADSEGRFKIAVAKSGKYTVRFLLPPKSTLTGGYFTFDGSGKVEQTNKNTTLEYEIDFQPGKCAYFESMLSVDDGSP